jgi:hypothetical protein
LKSLSLITCDINPCIASITVLHLKREIDLVKIWVEANIFEKESTMRHIAKLSSYHSDLEKNSVWGKVKLPY